MMDRPERKLPGASWKQCASPCLRGKDEPYILYRAYAHGTVGLPSQTGRLFLFRCFSFSRYTLFFLFFYFPSFEVPDYTHFTIFLLSPSVRTAIPGTWRSGRTTMIFTLHSAYLDNGKMTGAGGPDQACIGGVVSVDDSAAWPKSIYPFSDWRQRNAAKSEF